MDPNVTLEKIRTHAREAKRLESTDASHAIRTWHLEQACHLTEDLDAWLSAGGFLPHAWESVSVSRPFQTRFDNYLTPAEREEQGYTRAQ